MNSNELNGISEVVEVSASFLENPKSHGFVAYPRDSINFSNYGDPQRLKDLYRGYRGLSLVCWLNICFAFILLFRVIFSVNGGPSATEIAADIFVVSAVIPFLGSYSACQKLAKGMGRPPSWGSLLSIFIVLGTPIFFGILVCGLIQLAAFKEMKKYGVRRPNYLQIQSAIKRLKASQD